MPPDESHERSAATQLTKGLVKRPRLSEKQKTRINALIQNFVETCTPDGKMKTIVEQKCALDSQIMNSLIISLMVEKVKVMDAARQMAVSLFMEAPGPSFGDHFDFGMHTCNFVTQLNEALPDKQEVWDSFTKRDDLHNMAHACFSMQAIQHEFQEDCAEWSKDPSFALDPFFTSKKPHLEAKDPTYAAISGASGSGKTSTLIWVGQTLMREKLHKCVSIYLSCRPEEGNTPAVYPAGQKKATPLLYMQQRKSIPLSTKIAGASTHLICLLNLEIPI